MTTRAEVVACARTWLGTPWVHQGRSRAEGIDCAGLVICVARELAILPPDFDVRGYGRHPDGSLVLHCSRQMAVVAQHCMQPADVVVVSITGEPQHMGIVTNHANGGLGIIHAALKPLARVCETRLMFHRAMRFEAAFALLPGLSVSPAGDD